MQTRCSSTVSYASKHSVNCEFNNRLQLLQSKTHFISVGVNSVFMKRELVKPLHYSIVVSNTDAAVHLPCPFCSLHNRCALTFNVQSANLSFNTKGQLHLLEQTLQQSNSKLVRG